MIPVKQVLNLNAASATKIALAQITAGAANLTLTAAASSIDTSGAARIVLITTTSNVTAVNYTIVGKDADGNSITETAALPNSTTASSTNAYASISKFSVNGAVAANMSVGTTNAVLSALGPTVVCDNYARTGASIVTEVTGTIVYTVQETFDNILAIGTGTAIWYNGSLNNDTQNTSGAGTVGANLLSLSSVNGRSQADKGVTGVRISVASYTTGATLVMRVLTETNQLR
jgi:hypothetical protein